MRKIGVGYLKPGTKLAQSIYSSAGSIAIPAGTTLEPNHIDRLISMGVRDVIIEDPRVWDIDIAESISEDTKIKAITVLKEFYSTVSTAKRLEDIHVPYDDIFSVVKEMEADISSNKTDIVTLLEVTSTGEYMLVHPVNVAILSMVVAKRAGLGSRVIDVGIGAYLCDIGMALVPPRIIEKKEPLTSDEMSVVKKHPEYGLKILRLTNRFSAFTKAIVYQHHERNDGNGYPRGLKGQEIDPLARIISVADAYTSLISPRPYRERIQPQEAVEFIMSSAGFEFDHSTVQGSLLYVAPYPVGTMVKLNTGEKGVVIGVTKGLGTRPKVRVFYDANGKPLNDLYEVNLASPQNQTKLVAEVCED